MSKIVGWIDPALNFTGEIFPDVPYEMSYIRKCLADPKNINKVNGIAIAFSVVVARYRRGRDGSKTTLIDSGKIYSAY